MRHSLWGILSATFSVAVFGFGHAAFAQTASTAHLWVDTNGGTCTRSATPALYNDAAACGSFGAAYAAALGGDTVRIKPGTYGSQTGVGGTKTPVITLIGDGPSGSVVIDSGNATNRGLYLNGNVTVDNVDVAGDYPQFGVPTGRNSTWQNSRFRQGRLTRGCLGSPSEPILIYPPTASHAPVVNTTLRNIVVEPQRASLAGTNGCVGDLYHLEQIRVDWDVDGLLLDRVTFEACLNGSGYGGCGSGQVFITTPGNAPYPARPRNITIQNSVFKGSPNYWIQVHTNVAVCENWTIAYNAFKNASYYGCPSRSNMKLIGNLGPEPQNCKSGTTYGNNVWQWSAGTPCGTDIRITGANYQIDQLGLDSAFRPTSGSPAINTAETSYCTGALGSMDRDGKARPVSTVCDAGAFEFGSASASPTAPSNLRIIR